MDTQTENNDRLNSEKLFRVCTDLMIAANCGKNKEFQRCLQSISALVGIPYPQSSIKKST